MKDMICKKLKNGIKVYFYKNKNMKRTVVSYNVNYGNLGYYDNFYYKNKFYSMPPAVAHFLEHTLIEESKYGNMLHRFKDKNYEVNGLTGLYLTSYYFVGINEIKESIKMLINMIDDPVFNEESIEKVKNAIIEEVTKNDDIKYRIAHNLNRRNTYKSFEAISESLNTLGTKETTNSITYDIARTCYDAFYSTNNKFLVIGGNIDIDEMVEYLEEIYKELPAHKDELKTQDYDEPNEVRKDFEEIVKPVDTDYIIVTYKFKNNYKKEKIYLDLYLYFFLRMKFGSSTKFVTELINNKIIIGGIGWDTDYFKNTFTISFQADVINKDKFLEELSGQLNSKNMDKKDFELIKKTLKVNELSKLDYIYQAIKNFPFDLQYVPKIFILNHIEKITYEDVIEFIDGLSFNVKTVTHMKKN